LDHVPKKIHRSATLLWRQIPDPSQEFIRPLIALSLVPSFTPDLGPFSSCHAIFRFGFYFHWSMFLFD
jgi:hypothetical protein